MTSSKNKARLHKNERNSQMSNPESRDVVVVPRTELLSFFDEKPEWSLTHAGGVGTLVGEDLNTACFFHYLDSIGSNGTVIRQSVTTGKSPGPQLDRWIDVYWPDNSRTVFQTEIKNWSAHSLGGEILAVDACTRTIAEYRQRRWDLRWNEQSRMLTNERTLKVLVRMKPPEGVDAGDVRPLLIFWEALGPRESAHLFQIPDPSHEFPKESWSASPEFPELWVFSVSSYLRSVKEETLTLRMPNAANRLRSLQRLFSVDD